MTSKAFELAQLGDAVTVDGSGNVGVGDSTPSRALSTKSSSVTVGSFESTSASGGLVSFVDPNTTNDVTVRVGSLGNNLVLQAGGSERMKLESSGNIFMGSFNSSGGSAGVKFDIGNSSSETEIQTSVNGTATRIHYAFRNDNGEVGKITTNGSATTYATSSDYRLKENVTDVTDGITRIKQLSPKRFNFIADANKTVDGFIAHEVSSVVPEAIAGEKDEVRVWVEGEELPEGVSVGDNKLDSNDKTIPKYQGIDQSKLVPLLTAALQEAITKIETLETKVAALEAG